MRSIILTSTILLGGLAYGEDPAAAFRGWTLPASLELKVDAPRSWRFICDYYHLDTKGKIIGRERVSGLFTRGLPGNKSRWNDVSVAAATGDSDAFSAPKKREFMEGFTYSGSVGNEMLEPGFFPNFPPMAMQERNLVWDTAMFEGFAYLPFDKLKLNEPYHVPDISNLSLGGAGSFRHKDVQLIWTGFSKRNGVECAVIDYRAYFNTLELKIAGLNIVGRSHYWGQIWVSLTNKQIEYGTLFEDVLMDMTQPGAEKPQLMSVFRIGTLEPVKK